MLARVIVQIVLFLALQGAVLFVAAETVEWPGAWAFLGIMGAGSLAISLCLLTHDPALLAERLVPVVQHRQAARDRVLMAGCLMLWFGWLAFTALDAGRWGWSDVPVWAQVVGAAGMVATFHVVSLVFRANTYAAPVAKIQSERKQVVISSGPSLKGGLTFFLIFNTLMEWLVISAALSLNWHLPRRRALIAAGALLYYAARAWTYVYFVPNIFEFMTTPAGAALSAELTGRVREWVLLSWIRTGIDGLLAVLFLLAAATPGALNGGDGHAVAASCP